MAQSESLPTREALEVKDKRLAGQEALLRAQKPRREDYHDDESFDEAIAYHMTNTGRVVGFIIVERSRIAELLAGMPIEASLPPQE